MFRPRLERRLGIPNTGRRAVCLWDPAYSTKPGECSGVVQTRAVCERYARFGSSALEIAMDGERVIADLLEGSGLKYAVGNFNEDPIVGFTATFFTPTKTLSDAMKVNIRYWG